MANSIIKRGDETGWIDQTRPSWLNGSLLSSRSVPQKTAFATASPIGGVPVHPRQLVLPATARGDGAIVADNIQKATSQFLALVKSRAFWPFVISGGRVSTEDRETIVQSSVDTFLARLANP